MLIYIGFLPQVSITLIATGFKRQEENEGRPLQVSLSLSRPHGEGHGHCSILLSNG